MNNKKKAKLSINEIREIYSRKVYGNKKRNDNWRRAMFADYREQKKNHQVLNSKKKQIRLKSHAFNTADTFFRAYDQMKSNDRRSRSANKFDLRIRKLAANEDERRRIERTFTRNKNSKLHKMINRVTLQPFESKMRKLVKNYHSLKRRKTPQETLIKRFFNPKQFNKKNHKRWKSELKGKYLETLEIKPLVQSLNNSFFEKAIEKIDTSHIPSGGLINAKRLFINRMFKREFRSQSEKKKKFIKKFIFPNGSRSLKLKKLISEVDDREPGGCMQMTDLWSENTLNSAQEKMKIEKIKIELIRLSNQDPNRIRNKSKDLYQNIVKNRKKKRRFMERKRQNYKLNIRAPHIKLNQLVSEESSSDA